MAVHLPTVDDLPEPTAVDFDDYLDDRAGLLEELRRRADLDVDLSSVSTKPRDQRDTPIGHFVFSNGRGANHGNIYLKLFLTLPVKINGRYYNKVDNQNHPIELTAHPDEFNPVAVFNGTDEMDYEKARRALELLETDRREPDDPLTINVERTLEAMDERFDDFPDPVAPDDFKTIARLANRYRTLLLAGEGNGFNPNQFRIRGRTFESNLQAVLGIADWNEVHERLNDNTLEFKDRLETNSPATFEPFDFETEGTNGLSM